MSTASSRRAPVHLQTVRGRWFVYPMLHQPCRAQTETAGYEVIEPWCRKIIDAVPDALITVTATGDIVMVNPATEKLFGYSRSELIGKPVTLLMPEQWRPAHESGVRRFLETGEAPAVGLRLETEGLHRDGIAIPIELTLGMIPNEHREQTVFTAVVRDIAERKRVEHELARQTMRLHEQAQFFDLAFAAILVRDHPGGTIRFWNRAAEELYGWSAVEAVGHNTHTLLATRFPQPFDTIETEMAKTGRWEGDLEVSTKEGEHRVVRSRWAVQRGPAGRPISVLEIHTDVTERRQLESERAALLASAQEYVKRLEELASLKSDFTAMVAHELRNPLAAVRGLVDLLDDDIDIPNRSRLLHTIRGELEFLSTLVADVGAAAVAERHDFSVALRPIPIAVLIADAAAAAQNSASDHPVSVSLSGSGQVLVDPDRIGQVLRNLISNAVKHTPPGTAIELNAVPVGNRIRLEVVDHGPGISTEDLPRIFEKFGRGKDALGQLVPGVGLGLYLSRRIVNANGSELTVSSTPGEGTVFAFELEVVR